MKFKVKIYLFLVATVLIWAACRKTDSKPGTNEQAPSVNETRFFSEHRSANQQVEAITQWVKQQNDKQNFVTQTIKQIGYPRWDKVLITNSPKKGGRGAEDSSLLVYVPFVRDSQNYVNASMVIRTSSADTSFSYLCDWQYAQLSNTVTGISDSAEQFAIFFMVLDKRVMGHTRFTISDTGLFRNATHKANYVKLIDTTGVGGRGNLLIPVESCQTATVYFNDCPYQGNANVPQCNGPNGCDNCPLCTSELQYDYCWIDYIDDGSGGGNTGGTTGGGGSGSGGTPPTSPCPTTTTGNRGSTYENCRPGWVPIIDNPPPYVCNYQLTPYQASIFNQIDAEDNLANQNFNLDCQGTRRSGNINFPGTKEHWLTQIYYLSMNPVGGEREYKIPNAGVNPSSPGYADIVNLENGHIFEIKPYNFINLQPAINEVNNYVAKANLGCSSSLQSGAVWNRGTGFVPAFIPGAFPNTYLYLTSPSPGVIFYQEQILSTPPPLPVIIPQNILDKVKTLIERLKNNMQNANRIIAEFFQENPEVVNFIKGAAIGVGATILIATIVEDVATLGVGIADDWASFVLAQRIIRFAMAL
jgi:hypothetical protein